MRDWGGRLRRRGQRGKCHAPLHWLLLLPTEPLSLYLQEEEEEREVCNRCAQPAKPLLRIRPSPRVWALGCVFDTERGRRETGSGIITHKEYYFCPPSFLHWQRVGRKEGRAGKGERGGVEMNSLRLKELSNSDLYRRRQERPDSYGSLAGERFRWAFSRLSVKLLMSEQMWVQSNAFFSPSAGVLLCPWMSTRHLYALVIFNFFSWNKMKNFNGASVQK